MMPTTQTTSKLWRLDWRDFLKGLVVAVLSAVITVIKTSLDTGSLHFNWAAIGTVAGSAALAYLTKNLLTPSQTILKTVFLAVLVTTLSLSAHGQYSKSSNYQGFWKQLKNPSPASVLFHVMTVTGSGDTVWTGFKPTVSMALQAFPGGYSLAGVGVGWQHDTYRLAKKAWQTDIEVAALLYFGGNAIPKVVTADSLKAALGAGIAVSLLNKHLTVGPAWNFIAHQPMITFGTSLDIFNNP